MAQPAINPIQETILTLEKNLARAVANQEEAMHRMERLIANRRRNVSDGSHNAELNVGNIAVEIARHAETTATLADALQFIRMVNSAAELEVGTGAQG